MTKDNQDDEDEVENALKYLKAGFQKEGRKKAMSKRQPSFLEL